MSRSRSFLCAWTIVVTCVGPCVTTASADDTTAPIIVRGTERILWEQAGDTASLEFRVYLDGVATDAAATCDNTGEELACSAPLPFIAQGVHTLTITAVSRVSGLESAPSEPITVVKISTAPPSEPEARARTRPVPTGPANAATSASTGDSTTGTFGATVIAHGLKRPTDAAATDDGRLLVAEADGTIRIIDVESGRGTIALDTSAVLRPTPDGPLGLAIAPDFARSRLAFMAFVAADAEDRPVLEIVRVREVAWTLGEPATLFEIPLVADGGEPALDGPRLAIGPDGLLYVALPPGLLFDGWPTASAPMPTFARIALDGRPLADVTPLQGVRSHVRGFDWDTTTGELWGLLDSGGASSVTALAETSSRAAAAGVRATLPSDSAPSRTTGSLVIIPAASASTGSLAYALTGASEVVDVLRLGDGITRDRRLGSSAGRIGQLVAAPDGSLIAITRTVDWVAGAHGIDSILRVTTSRPRQ